MSEQHIYAVPANYKNAHVTEERYRQDYQRSIDNPEQFWADQAEKYVSWIEPWQQVSSGDFNKADLQWFIGGKLNVSYNCIDRHLPKRAQETAIIWEGDEPDQAEHITYQQLYEHVCRFANALKARGVKKGDRVCIYMPMIPEAAYAMLACARIGAVHSVVFGGFSPKALADRIHDAECSVLITADAGIRCGKTTPLKANADIALETCSSINTVFVVKHANNDIAWNDARDVWYHQAIADVSDECPAEKMDAEDPLFILYTSGSTGKPKGVLHTTGGYLVYAAMTHQTIFDYQPGDVYWCTADVGWITGHSYIVYGPLCNAATTVMFAGVPTYPDASRFWQVIDKHQVNIFYTAPTAIRALMREGDDFVKQCDRSSLKLLGTVGEPINPEVWEWYHRVVGDGRCPIVDTWWQTETGGIVLSPFPGATALKPGSATTPFFGIKPALIDADGNVIEGVGDGDLVMTQPWPGLMRTVYGDHQRFIETYFSQYPGSYCTGDGASRDEDGYYWITGRTDDVINVSGHRLGTAEVESALLEHPDVAEAAVVGFPHPIKGQGIFAFVTTKKSARPDAQLAEQLIKTVREIIGPIAKPDHIQWANALPKTRSGKIMRRLLRKIASHDLDNLGDTSTLANPEVVDHLIEERAVV